jgi:hypothetical protein
MATQDTPPTDAGSSSPQRSDDASVGEVFDLVKAYARQETLGPLKGAGRWLGFGVAGAVCLAAGLVLVALGALRFVQTQWATVFDGAWSFVPYLIVLVLVGATTAFALSRVSKATLNKEPR